MNKIKFKAEVKEVKARSTASMDKEIRIVLVTNEEQAMGLQMYIAEEVIEVEVK